MIKEIIREEWERPKDAPRERAMTENIRPKTFPIPQSNLKPDFLLLDSSIISLILSTA